MEVKFNSELSSVARANAQVPKPKPVSSTDDSGAWFGQTQALNTSLAGLPDLRVEKVDHAKALALTEHYPPPEIQRKIAILLAVKQDPNQ